MRIRTLLAAGLLAGTALLASACGSDGSDGSANGGPAGGDGNPDHDACLLGTWNLDVQDTADQVAAIVATGGAGATAETTGTVVVVFASEAVSFTHDNTMTMTMSVGGQNVVYTATYSGTARNKSWTAKDGRLTTGDPEGDIDVDLQASLNGQSIPMDNVNFPPFSFYDDGNEMGYTCSGNAATFTADQQPSPTWRMTRA